MGLTKDEILNAINKHRGKFLTDRSADDFIHIVLDMRDDNAKCVLTEVGDYYETSCMNQIEFEQYDSIEPEYCPYCAGKIEI